MSFIVNTFLALKSTYKPPVVSSKAIVKLSACQGFCKFTAGSPHMGGSKSVMHEL